MQKGSMKKKLVSSEGKNPRSALDSPMKKRKVGKEKLGGTKQEELGSQQRPCLFLLTGPTCA